MPRLTEFIGLAGYALEALGVLLILLGALLSMARTLYCVRAISWEQNYVRFRKEIGRWMLLGLEFLIAGDIIRTVIVTHTMSNVATLGLIVIIRTVLAFTMHLEVEGAWPWEGSSARRQTAAPGTAPPAPTR